MQKIRVLIFALLCGAAFAQVAERRNTGFPTRAVLAQTSDWPVFTLRADHIWLLNLPGGRRFDASGLFLTPRRELLTVSDRGPEVYRIAWQESSNSADLIQLPGVFTEAQLAPFAREKIGRYDCEGITEDDQGRIYLCEEANRWILRFDPSSRKVERLPIDWSPVKRFFDPHDLNASFEGITIHGHDLFVANERQLGRIIVVDLNTFRVKDHFMVQPHDSRARDVHYSDLNWFDGALYVLLRESHCVLKVDPAKHKVLAEYLFAEMELDDNVAYRTFLPIGLMEGLAVDSENFWLATDNNGFPRIKDRKDTRPTLFRCRRPDGTARERTRLMGR